MSKKATEAEVKQAIKDVNADLQDDADGQKPLRTETQEIVNEIATQDESGKVGRLLAAAKDNPELQDAVDHVRQKVGEARDKLDSLMGLFGGDDFDEDDLVQTGD